ncbi:MAG TPA: cysteine desulfurase family protein, partial [Urbifossiella sp.]|nr:cysteine desulfurase family protein [Urbifossiella sp.]
MAPIDLDANATTPLLPEAWEAMQPALREAYGNPSSAHALGRKARQLLEGARERVAELLGAAPDEVIFTSGATEANNLAIFGFAGTVGVQLIASSIEHPCVVEPLRQLEARGFAVDWLPPNASGIVPAEAAIARLQSETRLVSLMRANHETGAIQPVRELAQALPPSVLLHTDAAQAVGKIPVNFHELGVAALTASAHKFRGPKGIGILVLRRGIMLRPAFFGGHQQSGRRPGTEPVALALGMAAALEYAVRNLKSYRERWLALRARLW